jgi:hypothetical protein
MSCSVFIRPHAIPGGRVHAVAGVHSTARGHVPGISRAGLVSGVLEGSRE